MNTHGGAMAEVFAAEARCIVVPCDCRFGMACMPAESVDAVVCDPPYELGFMGKKWDRTGIAFAVDTWAHAFRVLKPGGHLLAFGGTRTWHRIAVAIEDAGFEIRDSFAWLYASGFPKSVNVSKAIDALLGAERPIVGEWNKPGRGQRSAVQAYGLTNDRGTVTAPATPEAASAEGYGTALKPAFEPIILARKPLDGTIAENFLKHGTGVLNIDGCRIACSPEDFAELAAGVEAIRERGGALPGFNASDLAGANPASPLGRWPANVLLCHTDDCERIGTRQVPRNLIESTGDKAGFAGQPIGGSRAIGVVDEDVETWRCAPGCPVAELDAQSGQSSSRVFPENYAIGAVLPFSFRAAGGYTDTGGASRFFFTAKPSRAERDAGLDEFPAMNRAEATGRKEGSAGSENPRAGAGSLNGSRNVHPTVKPIALMQWLVRLVTRPGSLVLDPFTGSGTTGIATMLEGGGRRFIGLELEPVHVEQARDRIAEKIGGRFEREVKDTPVVKPAQMSIFELIPPSPVHGCPSTSHNP